MDVRDDQAAATPPRPATARGGWLALSEWSGAFGARTGGAPVILGTLLVVAALFFSGAVEIGLALFPTAILGVILFVAGSRLALGVCEGWEQKDDRFVLVVVAALSVWNVGVAFLFGLATQRLLRRRLLEL
jgi:MFS superfamily sulfate permease-like transporter